MILFLTRVTIWKLNHAPLQKTRSGLSLYPLAIEAAKQPTFCEAILSPQSGPIVAALYPLSTTLQSYISIFKVQC